MSSFINIIVEDNINVNEFRKSLLEYSQNQGIGLFFENRFIEAFEAEIKYAHLCFSISDSERFDNCEFLVAPWWFQGHSIEQFVLNFKKIEGLLSLCLIYSKTVDLWMGESGDLNENFKHSTIKLQNLITNIQKEYQSSYISGVPPIHYTIVL
jgi:hypothetical protein